MLLIPKLSRVGWFQLGSIVALVVSIAIAVLLYRHETFFAFQPLGDFLKSANVALPPIILGMVGLVMALLTGGTVAEARDKILKFVRNKVLQSAQVMLVLILVLSCFSGWASYRVLTSPPPEYENLVAKILGSESDQFTIAEQRVKTIESLNPQRAENFRHVLAVFKLRAELNAHQTEYRHEFISPLIRSLETNLDSDPSWALHPLRAHALAEAYSIKAESLKAQADVPGPLSVAQLREHSIDLYKTVLAAPHRYSTPLLRASAVLNIGNAYYYHGQIGDALTWWRRSNSPEFGGPNTSSWGNAVAALVVLKDYKGAIGEATSAEAWAELNNKVNSEAFPYAGIVGNRGFAHAALGQYKEALQAFRIAYRAYPDNMSKLNLGLGLWLNGMMEEAETVLRQLIKPVTIENQGALATENEEARCGYLIWFVVEPNALLELSAARLYTVLGEARAPQELRGLTADGLQHLKARVLSELPKQPGPCGTLFLIPAFEKQFGS